jgi:ribA/ribD-fused uncharacterized protein
MTQVVSSDPGVIDQFSSLIEGVWIHSFLSNGYIEPDGSFVEREYQAGRAADREAAEAILACVKPFGEGGSKRMGHAAKERSDWERVKYQVMARCVLQKFLDHPELASRLLDTGDMLIIEGNSWHDNIWGDCRCGRPQCDKPGRNWLGHILMGVREALRQLPIQP